MCKSRRYRWCCYWTESMRSAGDFVGFGVGACDGDVVGESVRVSVGFGVGPGDGESVGDGRRCKTRWTRCWCC